MTLKKKKKSKHKSYVEKGNPSKKNKANQVKEAENRYITLDIKLILFHSEIIRLFLSKQLKFKLLQPPQPQSDLPPSMGLRVYLFSLP